MKLRLPASTAFSFFDTELMTNQLIGALLDELPVSLKKGTAVQHRYKLVFGHLRTEGLSDALELHLIIHQSRSFILSVPATRYITHKTLSEKQERTALIRVIRSGKKIREGNQKMQEELARKMREIEQKQEEAQNRDASLRSRSAWQRMLSQNMTSG
ncbi:hypothetical protein BLNAU_24992 [Blattamonas nauphoetae]|uniref:Uncharacterized protein n=1 Tax=Blattamonas nauphoetae TaxID=2049346 RepID=A0ABQ9WKV7_9EUKA|nr:hypothetical protein BLNAU_24992 [Blattamonas nauphoetae]